MPPTRQVNHMTDRITDDMTGDARRRPDNDRAREWLRRQLEWEEILAALRDAGDSSVPRRRPGRKAAAA